MEFYVIVGILGLVSLAVLSAFIADKKREYRELQKFRENLKRGDKVKVKGMEEPQIVYVNPLTGKIILDMFEKEHWYKSVSITDIYPWEDEVEYEIVHD